VALLQSGCSMATMLQTWPTPVRDIAGPRWRPQSPQGHD
jgi:hypothetical protein